MRRILSAVLSVAAAANAAAARALRVSMAALERVPEFPAGSGRYVATLTEAAEGRPSDGISVRVARLFPELGNRAREIGGFVYAGDIRFVRALAQPGELR